MKRMMTCLEEMPAEQRGDMTGRGIGLIRFLEENLSSQETFDRASTLISFEFRMEALARLRKRPEYRAWAMKTEHRGALIPTNITGKRTYDIVGRETNDKSYMSLFGSVYAKETLIAAEKNNPQLKSLNREYLDDHQTIIIRFPWKCLETKILIDEHVEYVTISIFLNQQDGVTDTASLQATFVSLDDVISSCSLDPRGYHSIHDQLYRKIWEEQFFPSILNPCEDHLKQKLGKVFVDFRRAIVKAPVKAPVQSQYFQSHVPQFKAFVTSCENLDTDDVEFAVSSMEDRHFFHISTARPQQIDQSHTCSLVCSTIGDQEALGRITSGLNHLGTLRFAAVEEIDNLRQAGQELRSIFHDIDIIRRDMYNKKSNDLFEMLCGLIERVANVENNMGFSISLRYRLDRAEYYIKRFMTEIDYLQIQKVDEHQTLDRLIDSQYGGQFEHIERMRRRYFGIKAYVQEIQQIALAQRTNELESQSAEEQKEITNLQQGAELGFWALLAPYYAGSVLTHVLGVSHNASHEDGLSHLICDSFSLPSMRAIANAHAELLTWLIVVAITSTITIDRWKKYNKLIYQRLAYAVSSIYSNVMYYKYVFVFAVALIVLLVLNIIIVSELHPFSGLHPCT
jgi:hypothetical protein